MNFNWTDNVVTKVLNRLADFVILNILWLVCSVPVITIGASTSALYSVMMKIVRKKEGYIVSAFIQAFKDNFKKSTIMCIVFLLFCAVIILDFLAAKTFGNNVGIVLCGLFLIFGIILVGIAVYTFSLQALYENTIMNTLKNAFILTFVRLPYTILILLVTVGATVLTCATVRTLMVGIVFWIFIGGSVVSGINCLILNRAYQIFKGIPKIDDSAK